MERQLVCFIHRGSDDVKTPSSYWLVEKKRGYTSRHLALRSTHNPSNQSQPELGVVQNVTATPAQKQTTCSPNSYFTHLIFLTGVKLLLLEADHNSEQSSIFRAASNIYDAIECLMNVAPATSVILGSTKVF